MGSRARGAFLVVVVCALSGIGCMEPLQSGGVMIVGDPGERIAAMCRFRHRDRVADLCGAEAFEVGAAPGKEGEDEEAAAPGEEGEDEDIAAPAAEAPATPGDRSDAQAASAAR